MSWLLTADLTVAAGDFLEKIAAEQFLKDCFLSLEEV